MAIDNYTPNPVNPAVSVHLQDCKAGLFAVRASVTPGCILWFLADTAYQLVNRALKELDAIEGGVA